MKHIDIKQWVESAGDSSKFEQRAAFHTLIVAISHSDFLRENMSLKGGLQSALLYQSSRFTMDADFSTGAMYSDFDCDIFIEELKKSLESVVEQLDYNIDLKKQRHEVNPKDDDKSFQTLTITIGFAEKGTRKHKKLINGDCPSTLKIDYSFNEQNLDIDIFSIDEQNHTLHAYSLWDFTAEKYRSIIQQRIRNRIRKQDAYDLYNLFSKKGDELKHRHIKRKILESFMLKSNSRGLTPDRLSLRDEEIIRRSRKDYHLLAIEVDGVLPLFEKVYGDVREYYESLPWDTI